MAILTLLLVAIGLSVDAFSLSLAYGLLNIKNKKILLTSLTVGIFHFLMPILGHFLALPFLDVILISPNYIISIIFLLIIVEMVKSFKEEIKETNLNFLNIILFAFFVSIDSFSVGIGLTFISENILLSSIIFSITSFIFTFIGLKLGKFLSKRIGNISKVFGIMILVALIFSFLLK